MLPTGNVATLKMYLHQVLQINDKYTDFVIILGNEKFQVHKMVLAKGSEYFKNIFENAPRMLDSVNSFKFDGIDSEDANILLLLIKALYAPIEFPPSRFFEI
jgi:hypothetical protein